jgi:Ca2+-binding RTX toxin-like protein
METTSDRGRGRAARRLLVGAALAVAGVVLASQPAGAATTAAFSSGVLTVFGDGVDNTITISRDAGGTILVNGGAIAVSGGTPSVANTTVIQVFGLGGNDVVTLDEANGALPAANLFGGPGNDTLTGGSSSDQLFGQAGNDTLLGRGGFDALFGSSENDTLTGGDADDQAFGESGDDRMLWNPGDDTDLNEGGSGADTVDVNGGGGAEVFTTTANGTRVRFDRLDPAPFSLDIGTSEILVVHGNGGDDSFSATGNLAALILIGIDAGAGNDTILGSNGIDFLFGGSDNDFVDGQQGNDAAFGGSGDDVFQWDPGDGSDLLQGQDNADTLTFNGSNGNEVMAASANGGRLQFTRNLGSIVMDVDDVEALEVNALGGTDTVTIDDLSGTDVTQVDVDEAGTIGGSSGDAAADVVIVNGTNGNDIIDITGSGTSASVAGLAAGVSVTNSEGANDSLVVNSLGGTDGVTGTTLPAGVVKLTIDGGLAGDTLLGSQGADVFLGGDGSDFVFGDNGNDVAFLGAGDDIFQWDPGDGNDTVEGQADADQMLFFGSNASENITISPNGGRVIFFRDIAAVTMDLDDVETIEYRALGGADNVVVGDMTGTDLTAVDADLRGSGGGGDAAADNVTVNGTNGDDTFGAAGDAGSLTVFGLQVSVDIFFQEVANDRLTLNALGGDDVVDATALEADAIGLTMNGGLGADVLLGGEGNDLSNGGDGDDTALMGAGDDTFVWNPGDDNDILEGQSGVDTMDFNGANVAESIDIAANGGRVIFFRNVANVVMDLNDVESIDFSALGGADVVVVNDLSGTDVTEINTDLAASGGGGDAQPDSVIVEGTAGDDTVVLTGDVNGTTVLGLAAQVNITGAETANDRVTVNTFGGDDVVEGSALAAGAIALTADGGDDADILVGGDNADTLFGGNGDDVLIGGLGLDVLDGGTGDNVVIQ